MKKILIVLLIITISFTSSIGVVSAAVNQNGTGSNSGASTPSGNGIDSCTVPKQYCERGKAVDVLAYRLTFVYAKDGGLYKMPVNANDATKSADSRDFWTTKDSQTDDDHLLNHGSRSRAQASKIEYVKGVKFSRISYGNASYKTLYKKGINYVHDSGLNRFLGSKYNGKKVMEYFSGTVDTDYQELVNLAKKMNIIRAEQTLSDLAAMSTDSQGYVLKLLIEPIAYYMVGTKDGTTGWLGGFFTATEIAMLLTGNYSYTVKTNDGNRSTCVFPLRGYLTSNDAELGFDAYTGSTKCSKPLNYTNIFENLGIMIVDLSDLPGATKCPVVFRTIALSNPFPGHTSSTRTPGINWNTEDNSLVNDYIINNRDVNADAVYNLKPMYKITLTPTLINSIKKYNKTVNDGYSNYSLFECDESDQNCKSAFIRDTYASSFSGCKLDGTC